MEGDTQNLPAGEAGQGDGAASGSQESHAVQQQEQTGQQEQSQEQQEQQQQAPAPLTPEQIAAQAADLAVQRMQSWQGRRDKDLFENLGNFIDSKLRSVSPPPQQIPTKIDPAELLTKPEEVLQSMGYVRAADIPTIMQQQVQNMTKAEQNYSAEVIRNAAAAMDADPLFTDKEFGNEVVAEIQKNFGSLSRQLPPNVAAQLLVSNSVANVYRKKAGLKANPLAGNKPIDGPNGTIKPPATPPRAVKPVKLSEHAERLAKRFGYKEEDLAKVFKD